MADDQPLRKWTTQTSSPEQTRLLAERLGRLLQSGDVVALMGELGSGKTLFSQGLAQGLEVPETFYITSPTFAIVNEYPGRVPFYHLDLFRISVGAEFSELGLEEILYGQGAVAIEWAERLGEDILENTPRIQWVSEPIKTEIVKPEMLYLNKRINIDSLKYIHGFGEKELKKMDIGEIIQLVRFGYTKINKITDNVKMNYIHG